MQGLYISSDTFLKLPRAYVDFRDPVHFRGEISRALSCALPGASELARARVCTQLRFEGEFAFVLRARAGAAAYTICVSRMTAIS